MPTYVHIHQNIVICLTCFIPIHFEPNWYTGAPLYLVKVWAKDWLFWQRFFMFPPATSCKCCGGILTGHGHFLPYPYLPITHDQLSNPIWCSLSPAILSEHLLIQNSLDVHVFKLSWSAILLPMVKMNLDEMRWKSLAPLLYCYSTDMLSSVKLCLPLTL